MTITKLAGPDFSIESLALIKRLRDLINDIPDDEIKWSSEVLFHLDRAADAIEFPKPKMGLLDITRGYGALAAFLERASARIDERSAQMPFPPHMGRLVIGWLRGRAHLEEAGEEPARQGPNLGGKGG